MISRRQFMGTLGATLVLPQLAMPQEAGARKKIAVVTTEWRDRSHAWHMAERFLAGYPLKGQWHRPPIDVVSAYVDQKPKNDLSQQRAEAFGFKVYPTVVEALRNGTDKMAVDGVLLIGEHGDYPNNELGQKLYPRYELFQKIVEVMKADGVKVPLFNDKHLSWKWEWAKAMVDTAKEQGIPFLAGSSLPVTWRMPAIDMPLGAEVEEIVSVISGPLEIYDFHGLEVVQCMAERRKGGESGVKSVQLLRGDSVWKAMDAGTLCAPKLFEACLARSQTLEQEPGFSHRYPTVEQMHKWVKTPLAYKIEYRDGLKATLLNFAGLVGDFTFAARIKGRDTPLSTLFYLPPNPNVTYSAALMNRAEQMFLTGKAPYPVERTLLTSGILASGLKSLAEGQKVLETPHLDVVYQPTKASMFERD